MANLWNELRYSVSTYPLLYALWGLVGLSWLVGLLRFVWLMARRRRVRRTDRVLRRAARALLDSLVQFPIWRVPAAGLMHLGLFAGGVLLLVAFLASHYLWPRGQPWQDATWVHGVNDIGMLLVLVGLLLAGWRRHVQRQLPNRQADATLWGLLLAGALLALLSFGLLVANAKPQWRSESFVSQALAGLLLPLGKVALRSLYGWGWTLLHGLLWVGALLLPWVKWRHALLAPLSLFSRKGAPLARMDALDLARPGPYGAQRPRDLTWKQTLDLLACTRCGRCTRACPAHLTGRALDPLQLMEALQQATDKRPLAEQSGADVLWDCTTCMACEQACPVGISPLDMLMDLRRERVLDAAAVSPLLQGVFRGLQQQGNPWDRPRAERAGFASSLGLPELPEGASCEVLVWLGCMGSYDERSMKAVAALARVLRSAGVDAATLGADEACCGDPARRTGNEYLWSQLAQNNIAQLRARRFARLISLCPHCANALANEYGDLGCALPAVHASVYLAELLDAGRLVLSASRADTLRLCFHDPCYLGRGNGIYAPARKLIAALPNVQRVELRPRRGEAHCCGGGGGQMWLEEAGRAHLETTLAQDVLRSVSDACATACPYCASMLSAGLADAQSHIVVRDVVEFLADSLTPAAAGQARQSTP